MSEPTMDRETRHAQLEKRIAELESIVKRDATQLRIAGRQRMETNRELRKTEDQLFASVRNLRDVSRLIYDAIWSADDGVPYVVTPLQQALDLIESQNIAEDQKIGDLQEQLDATGDEAAQLHKSNSELKDKVTALDKESQEQAAVIEELDRNLRNAQKANADLQEQLDASAGVVNQLQQALARAQKANADLQEEFDARQKELDASVDVISDLQQELARERGHLPKKVEVGDMCEVIRVIPVFKLGDHVMIQKIETLESGLVHYHVVGVSSRTGNQEHRRVGSDEVSVLDDTPAPSSEREELDAVILENVAYEQQVKELQEKLVKTEQMAESFQSAARANEEEVKSMREASDDNRMVTRSEYENMALRGAELRSEIERAVKISNTLRAELRRAHDYTDKLIGERDRAVRRESRSRDQLYRLKRKYALTGEAAAEDTVIEDT